MEKEIWKPIRGFEGKYEISNYGRIWSVLRKAEDKRGAIRNHGGMIRKISSDKDGYAVTCLKDKGVKTNVKVHRLVAEHFLPNPENKPEVNHLDEVKDNNFHKNLAWATHSENRTHNDLHLRSNVKRSKSQSIPIIQYKNGIPVKIWHSTDEAGDIVEGFIKSNISNVMSENNIQKTHRGYTFKKF